MPWDGCEALRWSALQATFPLSLEHYRLSSQPRSIRDTGSDSAAIGDNSLEHGNLPRWIRRLMRLMGIQAIYPRRNSSSPGKEHKRYPYLLRNLPITHVNQVWSADITYVPLLRGFMYKRSLSSTGHSRYVLAWQLSNTLDGGFCLEALRQALVKGQPKIFNTDQGAQFTADAFTACLLAADIQGQHGRPRPRPRQRLLRTPMAQRQVRKHLSQPV